MFKKLAIFLISFFLLATCYQLLATTISAEGEFAVDAHVEYKILDNGKTTVTHTVTLENLYSTLYATNYSLSLSNIEPVNPKAFEGTKELELVQKKDGDLVQLTVNFSDALVGKGKSRTFKFVFDESTFAVKTGEIWEITIPKLSDDSSFRSYSVSLIVPSSFGKEAYISPNPKDTQENLSYTEYQFTKDEMAKNGITAGFGGFQVFSFTLAYHLENPLNRSATTQIAIPPDTTFQKVYFDKISPKPANVESDADGNWIATYKLTPRERIDVEVKGSVQILAKPRPFIKPSEEVLTENKKPSEYWQVDDPEIKALAEKLKTPRAIYDYVVTKLSYNYDRVKPNTPRLGAKFVLTNPKDAICMEFTDLFIALSRAAGIPAREINGFAYTENPKLQPLSLVADVLHAWPEYWDSKMGVWVPIDPTWGSTTGGVDFFNKLDLRHFTFVIHGKDAIKPYPPGSYKLGPNPQKDVYVSFGKLPETRLSNPEMMLVSKKFSPIFGQKLQISVQNPGPTALYDLNITTLFDAVAKYKDQIPMLPPFGSYEIRTTIPPSLFAVASPKEIVFVADERKLSVTGLRNQEVLYQTLGLLLILLFIALFIFIKMKRDTIGRIIVNLVKYVKKYTKFDKNQSQEDKPE